VRITGSEACEPTKLHLYYAADAALPPSELQLLFLDVPGPNGGIPPKHKCGKEALRLILKTQEQYKGQLGRWAVGQSRTTVSPPTRQNL